MLRSNTQPSRRLKIESFAVICIVTSYFAFLSQGLFLWDDDYGLWSAQIAGLSWWELILTRILSPVPYTDQTWGFTERGLQLAEYKLFYSIWGYNSWPFFLFKSLCLGGLAGGLWNLMYRAGVQILPRIAVIIIIVTAPNVLAAFTWHADFAPASEMLNAIVLLMFINLLTNFPNSTLSENLRDKNLCLRWFLFCLFVYISYKSKANLKLVPLIMFATTLYINPKALRFIIFPILLLICFAIPWSYNTFTTLPPWFPGSGGSKVSWMFRESGGIGSAVAYLIGASDPSKMFSSPTFLPLSIYEIFGGLIVLIALLAVADYLVSPVVEAKKDGDIVNESQDLSVVAESKRKEIYVTRVVVLAWMLIALAGCTALPEISYFFRIRYGTILLIPFSIIFAIIVQNLFTSQVFASGWRRNGMLFAVTTVFLFQTKLNLNRALYYRSDLGSITSVAHQVYNHINTNLPDATIIFLPGFLKYAPPPNSTRALLNAPAFTDLRAAKEYVGENVYAIGWGSEPVPGFTLVKTFDGTSTDLKILNYIGHRYASIYKLVK